MKRFWISTWRRRRRCSGIRAVALASRLVAYASASSCRPARARMFSLLWTNVPSPNAATARPDSSTASSSRPASFRISISNSAADGYGILYFIGQPPADGSFDWSAFHAVVETWREASDNRDLAELTLVAAVREALEQNTASVAKYTRLVGRGERLPTPTAPVKTYDKIELAEMAVTRIHAGPEPNPNELITQAMTLLAQAREILTNHS
jgi:hypothetical protein